MLDNEEGKIAAKEAGTEGAGAQHVRFALRGSVYILPNLFTTASLFAGFWSLILSAQEEAANAAIAILFGALMDGLDGKVARLTKTASEFGIQYDSLADLVTFGVAPAFLVWTWKLTVYGRLGVGASFLFAGCAALRLARFNVSTAVVGKKFFIGLPSPAAGGTLALLVLFSESLPDWILGAVPLLTVVLTVLLGLLMVSRVRYFSFKEYGFFRAHPFRTMVSVLILFALVFSAPLQLGFLLGICYTLSGLAYSYLLSRQDKKKLNSLTEM